MFPYIVGILTGALAGFLGGFLGLGGALISTPILFIVYQYIECDGDPMKVAIGTSIMALVLPTIISTIYQYVHGSLKLKPYIFIAPGALLGVAVGVAQAIALPDHALRRFFALFEVLCGVYILLPFFQRSEPKKLKPYIFTLIGFGISTISGMLGLGGGMFTIPILKSIGFPTRRCIATSTALSCTIFSTGAILYFWQGHAARLDFSYTIVSSMALSAACFARLGVWANHKVDVSSLRTILAFYLIAVGLWMAFTSAT